MATAKIDVKTDLHGSDTKLKKLNKTLGGMEKQAAKGGKSIEEMGGKLKNVGKKMTIAGGIILGGLGLMVKKASDAEETFAKFGTIFEDVMPRAAKSIDELTKSYGLSSDEAKRLLGNTGDILTGFGFTAESAIELSDKVAKLGVDLASFTNIEGGSDFAVKALTSAMVGQTERAQALGIVIRQDTKEFKDLVKKFQETEGATFLQARAMTALEIATKQSKNAAGDFQRTSDSLANSTRIMNARLDDLVKTIGAALVPITKDLVNWAKKVLTNILKWTKENPKLTKTITKIALAIGALMAVVGPFLMVLPGLIAAGPLVGAAFSAMLGPIGLVIAGIVGVTVVIAKLSKEGKKNRAEMELMGSHSGTLGDTLEKVGKEAGLTSKEIGKLSTQYNGNVKHMARRIMAGNEGKEMQAAWNKILAETIAMEEKQRSTLGKLNESYDISKGRMLKLLFQYGSYTEILKAAQAGEIEGIEITKKVIEKNKELGEATKVLTELRLDLIDEMKKATLDEFEYKIWLAEEELRKRKEILKENAANSADFVLLEQAHAAELKEISDDRLEKEKQEADDKKENWTNYFKAIVDKENEFKDFKKGIKDKIDEMTLDEFELKEEKSKEAYEALLQDLKDNYSDAEDYAILKKAIEEGYSLELAGIQKERADDEKEKLDASLQDAKDKIDARRQHWEDSLIGQAVGSMTNVFARFATNVLDSNTSMKDALAIAWDGMKNIFFGIVEDMIKKWVTGFIDKLITSAAAGEAAVAGITAAATGASGAIGGVELAMGGVGAAGAGFLATAGLVVAGLAAIAGAGIITFNILKDLFHRVEKGFDPEAWTPDIGDPRLRDTGPPDTGGQIDDIFGEEIFAQRGFHKTVRGPKTFHIEPGMTERVDITPTNAPEALQKKRQPLTINFNINGRKIAEAMINDIRELSRLGSLTIDQQGIVRVES